MSDTDRYRQHLETLDRYLTEALECVGRQGLRTGGVLFHAGRLATYHRDDEVIAFRSTAHFRRWVPPLDGPEHVVLARPGRKLLVIRVRPTDYWYDISPPPPSYWEEAVELAEVDGFDKVAGVTGPLGDVAYAGSSPEAAATLGIPEELIEPEALMAPLDWYRAYKTEHEVAAIRVAVESAAAGHRRARELFEAGVSEREVHRGYLQAADRLEYEMPYGNIVAFNDKASILHYQGKRGPEVAPRTLLLDAGSAHDGYAADLTRTWARPDVHPVFLELLRGVDAMERELVAMVTTRRPYLEIHVAAHRGTAKLLTDTGIVKTSAEEAFDRGLTRSFLPHGVGHQIGLQVHDVGGKQAGPEGGEVPPPEEYPFLRNTRILEVGHVVTIEPGLYFTAALLDPLRASADASAVDWSLVEQLTPLGGIRIEDNVVCTSDGPDDLSRGLLEGP